MTPTSPDPDRSRTTRRKTARKSLPTSSRIASRSDGGGEAWTVSALLKTLRKDELKDPFRFWGGAEASPLPSKVGEMRERIAAWMMETERVFNRTKALTDAERRLLQAFLAAPKNRCTASDLGRLQTGGAPKSVDALKRAGILFLDAAEDGDAWVLPAELAERLEHQGATEEHGPIFRTLTLKGHLEQRYAGPEAVRPMPPARLREMYKMYANEAQAVARIERLPEGLRDLIGKVVLEFGGLLPRSFFEKMKTELPHWNQRRWAKILGESLVGTVERLELSRFGVKHDDDTLIVFNEVTLAWFKRVAVPSDPDAPHENASLGVDLVANISRFFAYLHDNKVRFTSKGEIFKTTEKRILTELIPNPGRELERGEVLQFIFQFARDRGFVEVTGERTFQLTSQGREWEEQSLETKLEELFAGVTERVDQATESMHQPAMRRVLLKMFKRLEIGVWYDVMYLPFLARNAYLAQIDTLGLEEQVAQAGPGGSGASEDLQRLAWNLVGWVRKRLYLLGIVDLGYDDQGHPVAMRLTRIGARVLGMIEAEPVHAGLGRLIVTPDFEVVLFGDGDDADLTHDLDRFADRGQNRALRQFKLTDRSVHRALVEGMTLTRMTDVLQLNSRTPVPQNVLHSIRDWSYQAGLLVLDEAHIVHSRDNELMGRFARDAGVRPFIRSTLTESSVQLKTKTSRARYRTLLRDLGYLVELGD